MLKQEELDSIKSAGSYCILSYKFSGDKIIGTKINNVDLDYEDFGEKYDASPESAPEYGCGEMHFFPFEYVKKEILEKYNITEEEYRKIQEKLDCLSFGYCCLCE